MRGGPNLPVLPPVAFGPLQGLALERCPDLLPSRPGLVAGYQGAKLRAKGPQTHCPRSVARTMATMPARTAGGSVGHAAIRADRSGSVGVGGVGLGSESPASAPDSAPLSDGPPVSWRFSGGVRVQYRPLSTISKTQNPAAHPRLDHSGFAFTFEMTTRQSSSSRPHARRLLATRSGGRCGMGRTTSRRGRASKARARRA